MRQRPSPVCFGRSGVCRPKPQRLAAFKAATSALTGKHRGMSWHIDLAPLRKKGTASKERLDATPTRPARLAPSCETRLRSFARASAAPGVLACSSRRQHSGVTGHLMPYERRALETGGRKPCAGPFTNPTLASLGGPGAQDQVQRHRHSSWAFSAAAIPIKAWGIARCR